MSPAVRRLHGVGALPATQFWRIAADGRSRCLHHTKEANKIRTLQNAYRKREAATPRDSAYSAGQIRGLGLLDRKDEEVKIDTKGVLPTLKDNAPRPAGQKPIVH